MIQEGRRKVCTWVEASDDKLPDSVLTSIASVEHACPGCSSAWVVCRRTDQNDPIDDVEQKTCPIARPADGGFEHTHTQGARHWHAAGGTTPCSWVVGSDQKQGQGRERLGGDWFGARCLMLHCCQRVGMFCVCPPLSCPSSRIPQHSSHYRLLTPANDGLSGMTSLIYRPAIPIKCSASAATPDA